MASFWLSAERFPCHVLAGQTIRHPEIQEIGNPSISQVPFDRFNLALHVGDDPAQVQHNRMLLLDELKQYGAQRLVWLEQTHSTRVHRVTDAVDFMPVNADAIVTDQTNVACMIMTADCLPIVLSDAQGTEVACIHAGWRGLLNGVIENTVAAMKQPAYSAWFGAAIGAQAFEVGAEVFDLFVAHDPDAKQAFVALHSTLNHGKYLADIYLLAKQRLAKLGVLAVSGGEFCSYQRDDLFYSYRREPQTGRMATFVMLRAT
jgi:YfiH family protein